MAKQTNLTRSWSQQSPYARSLQMYTAGTSADKIWRTNKVTYTYQTHHNNLPLAGATSDPSTQVGFFETDAGLGLS